MENSSTQIAAVARTLEKQLSDFLRNKRGEQTYTQFARKLGVSVSTLHRMEMGEQNVTLKTLDQLLSRLRCGISDIFSDDSK